MQSHFRPSDVVFVSGSSNEPTALLEHLQTLPLPSSLEFLQFPLPGFNRIDFTRWFHSANFSTFFMTPHLRDADPTRLRFLPVGMRSAYDYIGERTDVALIQVAEDANGVLRIGPNVDFVDAALSAARVVIAERNRAFRAPLGGQKIDPARITELFESDRPLPETAPVTVDETSQKIGELVASLIADGDCLQTGIGAIPAAILSALGDHTDLGLHGGLIDDGGMALIRAGVVNGAKKTIDQGQHIAGIVLGSNDLYRWLEGREDVVLKPANYTHDYSVLSRIDNFVSINSAVQVDLQGQVNAEVAKGRQISGTGGALDFMRGARGSRGGRSIVAMPATAAGGKLSRIVERVEHVTAPRTDVDIVVTEYGIAHLRDEPYDVRRERLTNISAPEFRTALRELPHAPT